MGTQIGNRLARLRAELQKRGLDGFLIPREDEFQGEYVPACAARLEWLTGFTGSAGFAAVLADKSAFFTDGRYTVQMKSQIDGALFERCSTSAGQAGVPTLQPSDWIEKNITAGAKLGYDPWLHTRNALERFRKAAEKAGATLTPCDINPLDSVWDDRPAFPDAPIVAHDLKFAGKPSADKRHDIAALLLRKGLDAAVLSLGDSIAWLLNIRGGDVPCTPFALSYAILHKDGTVDWFVNEKKLSSGLKEHLGTEVRVQPLPGFDAALIKLSGKKVLVDPDDSPVRIAQLLESGGAPVVWEEDPCQLPKACKNETELNGIIEAHKRDGAAMVRALKRIEQTQKLTELDVADILKEERAKGEHFRGLSFDTIAGSGPNGAIVHYRATPESHSKVLQDTLLLIDSGAQYLDGTTDITRTIAIGAPSQEMREMFTLVLKGHIALARARFPAGTNGGQLDVLARNALWQEEKDYAHGTGHGVGAYLSVHEGPAGISSRSSVALKPGMILSNEPGYYKEGEFGIRIESLIAVRESKGKPGWLHFETITLAPIDRALVDASLLSVDEIDWINDYHDTVRETLTPLLDADAAEWLAEATLPITRAPRSSTLQRIHSKKL